MTYKGWWWRLDTAVRVFSQHEADGKSCLTSPLPAHCISSQVGLALFSLASIGLSRADPQYPLPYYYQPTTNYSTTLPYYYQPILHYYPDLYLVSVTAINCTQFPSLPHCPQDETESLSPDSSESLSPTQGWTLDPSSMKKSCKCKTTEEDVDTEVFNDIADIVEARVRRVSRQAEESDDDCQCEDSETIGEVADGVVEAVVKKVSASAARAIEDIFDLRGIE